MLKGIKPADHPKAFMKDIFVVDLQANQAITAIFLVKSKEVKSKKTGEPYLSLTLADKSGDLDAKMWDNVEEVEETFRPG